MKARNWFLVILFSIVLGASGSAGNQFDVPARIVQAWLAFENFGPNDFNGSGIRNFYSDSQGNGDKPETLSLRTAAQISGHKIWSSKGPHSDYILYWPEKETRFGHYNPAFVRWAINNMVPGYNWGLRWVRPIMQPIYDTHFRRLARIFWISYRIIQPRIESVAGKYQGWCKRGNWGLQRAISFKDGRQDYVPSKALVPGEDKYYRTTHMEMAASWWARRQIDGTFSLFVEGLRRLLKTYDPDFWNIDLGYLPRSVRVETYWN
ncbi:MAG: hypothetical protein H6624_01595 [Bdellovibrionaceae bacterium]|nr:hypothetical protein [Bdellovibrionales bacterium]MCB9083001.1 hypothetical protein [Pseudobdellovibrionaceae bacterium]